VSFYANGFGQLAGRGVLYLLNQRWFLRFIDVDNVRFGKLLAATLEPQRPALSPLSEMERCNFERGLEMIKVFKSYCVLCVILTYTSYTPTPNSAVEPLISKTGWNL
jgi:hypothetical protein